MAKPLHPLVRFRKRQKPEMSQGELGEKLKPFVSDMTVSRWERRQNIPRADYLVQLSKLTGVAVGDLAEACLPENAG